MGKKLKDIAHLLSTPRNVKNKKTTEVEVVKQVPKVQLIYAFNGTGKTRLSREFKQLVAPKCTNDGEESPLPRDKILYYNAFTEDLFYWDNDLASDVEPKLKIQPNSYTDWLLTLLKDLGQDGNIVKYFQHYANDKLTPHFSEDFTEVTFSLERGDDEHSGSLKISKGEESNFIWSIFYTLLDQVITILNVPEPEERETNQFDQLEYVFIDDPVSSLDENHLIELAVSLAGLIKSSQSGLKFIITTHSPLFYNVLFNELNSKTCYLLERFEDGTFSLTEKQGDSNKSFSYHLYLIQTLEQAVAENQVQKYHFTLLRNLYEKTASFLGYPKWSELLPGDKQAYLNRIIQFTSHSTLSNDAVAEPTPPEKQTVNLLLNHLKKEYGFWQQVETND
ncbi:AAA family ATPase [Nitrincola iocasae]|uniref:AAA family ATPase n=1 Tax=Nitrincola iocasae TaxID=2614693 RepID=A0A5J6LEP0_9GAMM|nr:AAA family ATPase [Nitrincola iocasae]QEW06878.1 AAA family ATPase [Nitrincola iocasae]